MANRLMALHDAILVYITVLTIIIIVEDKQVFLWLLVVDTTIISIL